MADHIDASDALAEGLWDADDVARFLRISKRSVYSLPGLPRVKLTITGQRALVRYVPAEIKAWAKARLTHSMIEAKAS